jgi:hypothetical protein
MVASGGKKVEVLEEVVMRKGDKVSKTRLNNIWVLKRLIQISVRCLAMEELLGLGLKHTIVFGWD